MNEQEKLDTQVLITGLAGAFIAGICYGIIKNREAKKRVKMDEQVRLIRDIVDRGKAMQADPNVSTSEILEFYQEQKAFYEIVKNTK